MSQHPQDRCDLSGVRSEGQICGLVGCKNVVEQGLGSEILGSAGLGCDTSPELVVLWEARLELVARELRGDVCLVGAAVAGVLRNAFPQQSLDRGDKWLVCWERKARERKVCSRQAAVQWGSVEPLRSRNHLLLGARKPELVGGQCLVDTVVGQVSITPHSGSIAVQERPIAVPGWSTIVGLCGIMPAFPMSSHEE